MVDQVPERRSGLGRPARRAVPGFSWRPGLSRQPSTPGRTP